MQQVFSIVVLLSISIVIGASAATAADAPLHVATPTTSPLRVWSTAENVANTATSSRAPQLVVTGNGTVHVVWEEGGSIYHTFRSGGVWSTPAEIVAGDSPSLAVGGSGVVHMAYVSEIGGIFDIFYTRWDGSAWTLPVNVSHTSGVSTASAIAFVPGGTLHIVWPDTTGGKTTLYHGQSSDGSTWSTFPIPNGAGSAPAVAVGPDDVLHLAWQSADSVTGHNDIWHMQFSSGSWSLPEDISATPNVDSTLPTIAVAPDNTVYIVWQEALGTNTAVYYATGQAGNWSLPDDVSGTLQAASFPVLSVDSIGIGFLVWDEGSTIMGRQLDTGTGRWLAREQVAGDIFGISDPTAFLDGGTIRAAWAEEVSSPNWDIFYKTRAACVLADVNGDRQVGLDDVAAVATRWHASTFGAQYDLNGDGAVTIIDIVLVANQWGTKCA